MNVKEPRSLVRQLLVDKALSATNGEKDSNPLGASRSLWCLSMCSTSDLCESSDDDALEGLAARSSAELTKGQRCKEVCRKGWLLTAVNAEISFPEMPQGSCEVSQSQYTELPVLFSKDDGGRR